MVKKKHRYEAHCTNSTLPCVFFEEQLIVYRFKNKALTKAQLKQS